MNINPSTTLERVIAADLPVELVRGEEQPFLDRILPLVLSSSVAVDLSGVRRIDAAAFCGASALTGFWKDPSPQPRYRSGSPTPPPELCPANPMQQALKSPENSVNNGQKSRLPACSRESDVTKGTGDRILRAIFVLTKS
jgi:hypothetical protein